MLRITAKQIDAFNRAARTDFLRRVALFLRQHFSDADDASAEFLTEVRQQVRKAYAYGLATEREVVAYVVAAKYLGEHFDQHRMMNQYLIGNHSPAEKVQLLETSVLSAAEGASKQRRRMI